MFEKSTLLGAQSVDSLTLWGVQAEYSFNKDCPQSFPGPLGRPGPPKLPKNVGNQREWVAAAAVAPLNIYEDTVRGTVFAPPENIQEKATPIKTIEKPTNPNSDFFEKFHDPPPKHLFKAMFPALQNHLS